MLWSLFLQIAAGILGLFLAQKYVPGVDFTGPLSVFPSDFKTWGQFTTTLVFAGAILGILNYFVKPVLKLITLPLRLITFNLFTIVIAIFLVWLVNIFSAELTIRGLGALFFTTLIVWAINFVLSWWLPEKSKL